jgi:hypothetical protein
MVIGVAAARASGHRARGSRPTVREVCLLGLARQGQGESWLTGQIVTWLGRGYRVVAMSAIPAEYVDCPVLGTPVGHRYVHLAPGSGGWKSETQVRGARARDKQPF